MNLAVKYLQDAAFKKLGKKNTNLENPYYEKVPVVKNGTVVKYQKKERAIPPGLTDDEAKILKSVRKRAYRWDMCFTFCCFGFVFGWSAIFGLVPVIGDFFDFFMGMMLLKKASRIKGGLPNTLYARMFTNILIDLAVGFVPFLGDLADAYFRANTRNAWLLDAYLTAVGEARMANTVQNPDGQDKVRLPDELRLAPGDRDVETGVEPSCIVAPAPVTPSPAANPRPAPAAPMASIPGASAAIAPLRSMTGQRKGREVQDPRDQRKGGAVQDPRDQPKRSWR